MPERCLRIAMLTHSVNPRGGVVHALELAQALQQDGHDVTLMAPAAPGTRFFRAPGCAVDLAPLRECTGSLVERVRARIDAYVDHLGARLRHPGFDVLHAQDSISGMALATLRSRGLVEGFVRTVHHLDTFNDERLTTWQHRAFAQASQVLCVSRLWYQTLKQEHGVTAVQVANGIDLGRYRPEPQAIDDDIRRRYGLRPGAPMILAVGGIEERKNTLRLLEAFMRLRQDRPGAQLVIAGGASVLDHDAYTSAFSAAVAASGLRTGAGEAIVLTGTVADDAMPALYRLADVLAMPSLREGFGLAVLEALASGTPAVASRRAPFTEHLGDADASWADPLDVGSIARALSEALSRPSHAGAGPPAVCRRYRWSTSARHHARLYRAALAETSC